MVSTWTLSVDKEKDWEHLKTHTSEESKEGRTKYLATLSRSVSFWASLCRRRSSSRPVKLDIQRHSTARVGLGLFPGDEIAPNLTTPKTWEAEQFGPGRFYKPRKNLDN